MNTDRPDQLRRSGRQPARTKFFIPHFDESYMTPKSNKLSKKREVTSTQGGLDNLRSRSASSSPLNWETKKRCPDSHHNLFYSASTEQLIDESKRVELKEQENSGIQANIRDVQPASRDKSAGGENATPLQMLSGSSEKKSHSTKRNNLPAESKNRKTKIEKIKEQLRALGDKPDDHGGDGNCARAAIYNGFIKLTGQPSDLDQVIISGKLDCGHNCNATLGNLLSQPDQAGTDYLDLEYCTVFCDADDDEYCGATYVTGICCGNPTFDNGKSHNHCNGCKKFGKCIGDYRKAHCSRCGKHYFAGSGGQFGCERCDGSGSGGDDCVLM